MAGRHVVTLGIQHPPFEYGPVSSDPPGELIEVGPEGTVVSWSWMPEPLEGQPLAEPFAWALIRLDGADTAMLHAVDAGSAAAMRTGLRPYVAEPLRAHDCAPVGDGAAVVIIAAAERARDLCARPAGRPGRISLLRAPVVRPLSG